ncbi:MAG TPA: restriction endonuclease subunit S [Syntrophales bacterium]|nr:restriction endonuclease subunit S [Syntrophales bacterium]
MTDVPYKLPEGWRWVRLGEVASEIQSGFAFRKKGALEGDILHIRPYNIGDDGELKIDQQFLIPSTVLPDNWSPLRPGDVLFNNTNSVELVGKTALVRTELRAAFSNHINRIRTRQDLCDGAWLAFALNKLWHQGLFAQGCNKWIGQAGYNTEMLRETSIPLPPLGEQRRIVALLEQVQEKIRSLKAGQEETGAQLKLLERSILDKAFRGEL